MIGSQDMHKNRDAVRRRFSMIRRVRTNLGFVRPGAAIDFHRIAVWRGGRLAIRTVQARNDQLPAAARWRATI